MDSLTLREHQQNFENIQFIILKVSNYFYAFESVHLRNKKGKKLK